MRPLDRRRRSVPGLPAGRGARRYTPPAAPAGRGHTPAPIALVTGLYRAGRGGYRLATQGRNDRRAEEEERRRHTELIEAIRTGPAAIGAGPAVGAALAARPAGGLAPRPGAGPNVTTSVVEEQPDESGRSWRFRNRRWLRCYYLAGLMLLWRLIAHVWTLGALIGFAALAALAVWWFLMVARQWRYDRAITEESGITIGRKTITGPAARVLLRAGTWWTPRIGVLLAVAVVLGWLCIPVSVPMVSWALLIATIAATVRWGRFRVRRVDVVEAVPEDDTLSGRWLARMYPIGLANLLGWSIINPDPASHRNDDLTGTTVAEILLRDDVHARQVIAQASSLRLVVERRLGLDMDTVRLKLAGDARALRRPVDRILLVITAGHHMRQHAVAWPGAEVYERDGCYFAPIGEEEDGTIVELILADKDGVKHVLIVGNTGAGKTGTGNLVLLAIARVACVIYLDGKQGDSAPHLTDAMWARCVTGKQMRAAISWLYAVMKDRQRRRGRDKTGGRWRMGREPEPAFCLYLEEASGVKRQLDGWRDERTGLTYEEILLEIGEQGRALGLLVVYAQHNPAAVRTPGGKDMRGFLRGGGNAILLRQLDGTTARLAAEGCPDRVPELIEQLPPDAGWAVYLRHDKLVSGKYRNRWAQDEAAADEARTLRTSELLIRPARVNIDVAPGLYDTMMADPYADELAAPDITEEPQPQPADLSSLTDAHRLVLAALLAGELGRLPVLDDEGRPTGIMQPAAPRMALTPLENACGTEEVVAAWLGRTGLTVARRTLSLRLGELRDWGLADKERERAHFAWFLTDAGRAALAVDQGEPDDPSGDCGCGAQIGAEHRTGCGVAQCLACGLFLDDCHHPDGGGAVWDGMWPGDAELLAAGLTIRQVPGGEWEPCDPTEPGAVPDYDQLERLGTWDPEARRWRLAAPAMTEG